MLWKRVALAACLTPGITGCNVYYYTARNLLNEPIQAYENVSRTHHLRHLAKETWKEVRKQYPRKAFTEEFRDGFINGFSDYLDKGGNGEMPVAPPVKYTRNCYLTPEGQALIQDYYLGFRYGLDVALASRMRPVLTVPIILPEVNTGPYPFTFAPQAADGSYQPMDGQPSPQPGPGQLPLPTPRQMDPAVPSVPSGPGLPDSKQGLGAPPTGGPPSSLRSTSTVPLQIPKEENGPYRFTFVPPADGTSSPPVTAPGVGGAPKIELPQIPVVEPGTGSIPTAMPAQTSTGLPESKFGSSRPSVEPVRAYPIPTEAAEERMPVPSPPLPIPRLPVIPVVPQPAGSQPASKFSNSGANEVSVPAFRIPAPPATVRSIPDHIPTPSTLDDLPVIPVVFTSPPPLPDIPRVSGR